MASSKKWASTISSIASFIFFLVIILQIPLFRAGICRAPLELTCSQLIATKLIPEVAVKTLLYPEAVANAFFNNKTMPSYYHFLKSHYSSTLNTASMTAFDDLQRLEVLAGSYLSVAGAFVCLIIPGRTSLFGTLLIIWGLVREVITGKAVDNYTGKDLYIYPAMSIALVSAFLSVRKDVRRIFRSCRGRQVPKAKLV